ncbi:hypothetical protein EV363DRAFT_958635 [Boletus edulis]|nr:hypothetical protein EV363DRAFT_958635 [Boletus edulis]
MEGNSVLYQLIVTFPLMNQTAMEIGRPMQPRVASMPLFISVRSALKVVLDARNGALSVEFGHDYSAVILYSLKVDRSNASFLKGRALSISNAASTFLTISQYLSTRSGDVGVRQWNRQVKLKLTSRRAWPSSSTAEHTHLVTNFLLIPIFESICLCSFKSTCLRCMDVLIRCVLLNRHTCLNSKHRYDSSYNYQIFIRLHRNDQL